MRQLEPGIGDAHPYTLCHGQPGMSKVVLGQMGQLEMVFPLPGAILDIQQPEYITYLWQDICISI